MLGDLPKAMNNQWEKWGLRAILIRLFLFSFFSFFFGFSPHSLPLPLPCISLLRSHCLPFPPLLPPAPPLKIPLKLARGVNSPC
ncbi:hypothetical protein BDDG_12060 [Blastomyces dermatitidis ATCC 18188]|uniref:Uncharacterized protein n=1 Tax=Ajellomyces dermatitidis (strain ATCC 18188 / CBS 674.68) TaxID=653446 RepID=A0A0J9EQ57_AJEDA|nr:hypothetical protein BDDG_12060 [Blastomyces dermatitidis ATCC 18188]